MILYELRIGLDGYEGDGDLTATSHHAAEHHSLLFVNEADARSEAERLARDWHAVELRWASEYASYLSDDEEDEWELKTFPAECVLEWWPEYLEPEPTQYPPRIAANVVGVPEVRWCAVLYRREIAELGGQ